MNLIFIILIGLLLGLFALFVRVIPIWKNRYRGCDAYYYLLCDEEFRKKRKLPIILPHYFLLDIREQWYPPGFIVFLSLFPKRFVEKYYWGISPMVDVLILLCLYATTYLLTANIMAAIIAGFLYALTPAVIAECSNLNSRPLGNLLLTATILSTFIFANNHNLYALVACLVFGVCLLMAHKMSAQLLYFVLPLMSLVFWSPIYVLIMLGIVAVTFILSGELFVNVLKGQYDILRFWKRNWKNLGAHQVYSSPIYGKEDREDSDRVFQKGFKGLYKSARSVGMNVYIALLIFPLFHYSQLSLLDRQMLWWVILTYVLVILTLLIPQFKFYGEGFKYLRMVVFPIAYLSIMPFLYDWNVNGYFYGVLTVATIATIVVLVLMHRWRASAGWSNPPMDSDLSGIVNYLKGNKKVRVILSVPAHLMDTVVYHCRKKVVWGTHSDNFNEVEPFWPVYRKPLGFFVEKYKVSHIVVADDYVLPKLLHLSSSKMVFRSGNYEIYET